jgi:hypothetical protein
MKRLSFVTAILFVSVSALAQNERGILNRFTDPEKGSTVFIEKGHRAINLTGGYRSIKAGGDAASDGYSILSLLNIGEGEFVNYSISPSFSLFFKDDVSLDFRLEYSGYKLDADIRADLREVLNMGVIDDEEERDSIGNLLNIHILGRHMSRKAWGTAVALRRYMSFFGSKTIGLFGEARIYGEYGRIESYPLRDGNQEQLNKSRTSDIWATGLKLGAGICVKLRDNSALTLSIPLLGATYSYTSQRKAKTDSKAHLSQFNISRDVDYLAIQIGYSHYIQGKKR